MLEKLLTQDNSENKITQKVLPQTVLSCSYIYHAEELPEPPSQISAILSTH